MYHDTVVSYLSFLSVCAFYSAAIYWNTLRMAATLDASQRVHYLLITVRGYGEEVQKPGAKIISLASWKKMKASRNGWCQTTQI